METGLYGKVVLVTGGAGGIGQAICRAFAAEGARVVVHHHSSAAAAVSLAEEIDGIAIRADLRDAKEALSMVRSIVSDSGGLDVCIANAGHYPTPSKPFWEIDTERWTSTMDSNLGVTANTARAFLGYAAESDYDEDDEGPVAPGSQDGSLSQLLISRNRKEPFENLPRLHPSAL